MKCPRCGHEIPKDAAFCTNCGFKLSKLKTENQSQLKHPEDGIPDPQGQDAKKEVPSRQTSSREPLKCPQCGHEVLKGATFCTNCGARLGQQEPNSKPNHNDSNEVVTKHKPQSESTVTSSNRQSAKCPNCGHELPKGATFCTNCGAKISGHGSKLEQHQPSPDENENEQSNSENVVSANDGLRCPNCGQQLPAGTVFCTNCGAKVAGESAPANDNQHVGQSDSVNVPERQRESKGSSSKKIWIIIGGIVLAILIILGITQSPNFKKGQAEKIVQDSIATTYASTSIDTKSHTIYIELNKNGVENLVSDINNGSDYPKVEQCGYTIAKKVAGNSFLFGSKWKVAIEARRSVIDDVVSNGWESSNDNSEQPLFTYQNSKETYRVSF